MVFWVYNLLILLFSPFWVPWMVWRAKKRKEQPDWRQRCGDLPIKPPAKGVRRAWIHAVSVGEVMAALPVLKEVRALDPGLEIVLSTTTSSGQTAAKERAEGLFDHLVYFPIDVPRFVLAALMRVRPKVVAVMETELWLNFLWTAKNLGARTILLNGRVSDRSFNRSLRLKPYYKALAREVDEVLTQSEEYADRFRALGFQDPKVVGNTKYDAALADSHPTKDWKAELRIPSTNRVIVIGSTRSAKEEQILADALAWITAPGNEDVTLVHAPRHIERASALVELYRSKFQVGVALRSLGQTGQVIILDTYGELGGVYSIADVAIIGGSFDDFGGQNLIQPLAHGVPVVHGPYMQNFRDVADAAQAVGASLYCRDNSVISTVVGDLLEDREDWAERSKAARALVQANLGASRRCAEAIVTAAKV